MNVRIHRLLAGAAMASVATLPATPARADVIELSPQGGVVVYSRPAVITPGRASPIEAPAAATSRLDNLRSALTEAGASAALSPLLLEAVAWAESRFNPEARSPAGAIGVMQLMPGTAAELGVDPSATAQNVRGGAQYLRQMLILFDGDVELALAAYNAGPDAVRRYGGVPPFKETRNYVSTVMDYLAVLAEREGSR